MIKAIKLLTRCGFLILLLPFSRAHAEPVVHLDAPALARITEGQNVRLDKLDRQTLYSWDKRDQGEVVFYRADRQGQSLKVELKVPQDGYYRIRGGHVHGPWKPGRFGLFKLKVAGILMPGQQHGWYSTSAPKHWPKAKLHVQQVDWGAIYLRKPQVTLAFERVHHTGGMLGITRLELHPVKETELTNEEKARRVPERRKPPAGELSILASTGSTSLDGKVPVWQTSSIPTIDGDLDEWNRKPDIQINKTTIKTMGHESPPIHGDEDLSLTARMMWDDINLYFAATVSDDELAPTVKGQNWKGFWEYDGIALIITVPPWLQGTTRHPAVGKKEIHIPLNFYTESGPRPIPDGGRYVCKRMAGGYRIEAAIPFRSLGLHPQLGDRLGFFVIAVNRDPSKPEGRHFGQYIWNKTRGELRLVSATGAGGELIPESDRIERDGILRYVGSADTFQEPTVLSEVQLINLDTGKVTRRWPLSIPVSPGRRHQLAGALPLDGIQESHYEIRLVWKDK